MIIDLEDGSAYTKLFLLDTKVLMPTGVRKLGRRVPEYFADHLPYCTEIAEGIENGKATTCVIPQGYHMILTKIRHFESVFDPNVALTWMRRVEENDQAVLYRTRHIPSEAIEECAARLTGSHLGRGNALIFSLSMHYGISNIVSFDNEMYAHQAAARKMFRSKHKEVQTTFGIIEPKYFCQLMKRV